jgi:hypothetical protein
MISCPKCAATLPDWTQNCQFCHADTSKVIRPVAAPRARPYAPATPQWVWGAYYAIAGFYILQGGYDIVEAVVASQRKIMGEQIGFGFFSALSVVFGAVTALIGIGLLLKVEVVRGIVNFFCGLQIMFGLLGLAGSFIGALFTGPWGLLGVVMNVAQIAAAAFMIYLIGETDRAMPDL